MIGTDRKTILNQIIYVCTNSAISQAEVTATMVAQPSTCGALFEGQTGNLASDKNTNIENQLFCLAVA